MKYLVIILSLGLASVGLFLVNQLFAIQLEPTGGGGSELSSIYICGVENSTQYTLYNDTEQLATLVNSYFQSDGMNVGTAVDTIPSVENRSYTVGDHVPGGFSGDAIVSSDTPLTATIDTGPGTFLTAKFTADPLSGSSIPQVVTFTNLSQGYDSVLWDFGDGITSTLPSPSHTYTSSGNYTVTLTTDKTGCLDALPEQNPSDSVVIQVGASTADLAVGQSAAPEPATAGEPLTYTVTITNNGPAAASGLVVSDTLPTSATFLSASDECLPSGGLASCEINMLANGATASFTITVLAPQISGSIINTVTIIAATDDPDGENNTAVLSTTVEIPDIYLPIIMTP